MNLIGDSLRVLIAKKMAVFLIEKRSNRIKIALNISFLWLNLMRFNEY